MGKLVFGRLTEAWKGEASDFTPLLAERLDQVGAAIGVDLTSVGQSEVSTTGGRRIDIVAEDADGAIFVIENQYGRADHDHLTRGLAYAVAAKATGLVVVAEEHRDEFRAVAEYLNDLAAGDRAHGIAVWLVEARAVRVDDSIWAPLFTAVVEPNDFVFKVEQSRAGGGTTKNLGSTDEFLGAFEDVKMREAARMILDEWLAEGGRRRLGPNHVVLEASGPSKSGVRSVVALYTDGRVLVPFSSYQGQNSGIAIPSLSSPDFRAAADRLFGFTGTERQATTSVGWLSPGKVPELLAFCKRIKKAYREFGDVPAVRVPSRS